MNTSTLLTTTGFNNGLLLDNFVKDEFRSFFQLPINKSTYPYDLYEENKNVILHIPLAGYSKDNISVEVKNDTLCVNIKESETKERPKYFHKRIKESNFSLSLFLGNSVKTEEVKASLKDGLLKVTMPKNEEKQSKVVEIQ